MISEEVDCHLETHTHTQIGWNFICMKFPPATLPRDVWVESRSNSLRPTVDLITNHWLSLTVCYPEVAKVFQLDTMVKVKLL